MSVIALRFSNHGGGGQGTRGGSLSQRTLEPKLLRDRKRFYSRTGELRLEKSIKIQNFEKKNNEKQQQ